MEVSYFIFLPYDFFLKCAVCLLSTGEFSACHTPLGFWFLSNSEYGPKFEKCKPWLLQHCPEMYPNLQLGGLEISDFFVG